MKYATFGQDGALTARYDDSINAVIPNGAVPLADDLFLRTISETDGLWKLVNGTVTKTSFPASVPTVPTVISMRQARQALYQSGYLSQVDSLVAAMPGADGEKARIDWNYAGEVKRSHPLVAAMAAQLTLTESQLDDLFTLGASL